MANVLDIDGSVLEGGGQILRLSISLGAILGVPVRVYNIRAGRPKPGLAAQHLKGIQLVADLCQAKLKGAYIGSTEVEFNPGKIKGGHYVTHINTAGAISLLLQVALPCALLADGPVTLDLKGGTNAEMAPQIDYMQEVFRPLLKKFDADFQLEIRRRGYFPKGGGHVTVEVTPVRRFKNINLSEQGEVVSIRGSSFVAGALPLKVAQEMTDGAMDELKSLHKDIHIKTYKEDRSMAPDSCTGIVLWSELSSGVVVGSDALGRRGRSPRQLGATAGELLKVAALAGSVDSHAQDQLILYMALAEGKSSLRTEKLTLHTKTAMHIVELFTKIKFDIQTDGESNLIECVGLGFVNKNLPPA